jgi:hypothetical protein
MKIETKFDVNGLVVSKYHRGLDENESLSGVLCCFEVLDIKTTTCMAGTQVHYVCRAIYKHSRAKYINGERVLNTAFYPSGTSNGEYVTFREDELVAAPKEIVDLIGVKQEKTTSDINESFVKDIIDRAKRGLSRSDIFDISHKFKVSKKDCHKHILEAINRGMYVVPDMIPGDRFYQYDSK